jgi:hypothetical protein
MNRIKKAAFELRLLLQDFSRLVDREIKLPKAPKNNTLLLEYVKELQEVFLALCQEAVKQGTISDEVASITSKIRKVNNRIY